MYFSLTNVHGISKPGTHVRVYPELFYFYPIIPIIGHGRIENVLAVEGVRKLLPEEFFLFRFIGKNWEGGGGLRRSFFSLDGFISSLARA